MSADQELFEQTLKWIKLADEDLRLAEFAFNMESNIPLRLIGFHAQQAAEKYLKAYLVNRLIDFPYTHSINVLLELCPLDDDVKLKLKPATVLTDYAVARRYPVEYTEMTISEARELVRLAGLVKSEILGKLLLLGYKFGENI